MDNGQGVTDAYKIAEYLDKTYPDTLTVILPGSEAPQAAFYDQFLKLMQPLPPLYLPRIPGAILNPASVDHFNRTRSDWFWKPLHELEPAGGTECEEAWKKVQEIFDLVGGWMSKCSGPFFMGAEPTLADFTIASLLKSLEICFGEGSKEWENIGTWNGGRWRDLVNSLEKYASVN